MQPPTWHSHAMPKANRKYKPKPCFSFLLSYELHRRSVSYDLCCALHDAGRGVPHAHNGIRAKAFCVLDHTSGSDLPSFGKHICVVGHLAAHKGAETGHHVVAEVAALHRAAPHHAQRFQLFARDLINSYDKHLLLPFRSLRSDPAAPSRCLRCSPPGCRTSPPAAAAAGHPADRCRLPSP